LGLGVLLIALGSVAIARSCMVSIVSVVFFGWLLIVGGALEMIHAFWRKGWSGFFIDLLSGILHFVVGFMLVSNPGVGAQALTLLIAMFLMLGGIFRIVAAIALRYPHWGWLVLHGMVMLLLGNLIWRQWPVSGLWVIGLFIGIELIFDGWALAMLGITARTLPAEPSVEG
jgi:uncharacterized membrane protein HdeD (DUF308 family)